MNDAIAQYPDYGVVLVMNSYIDANAKLTAFGELVEKEIVQDNETVCLILCGGAEGTARLEKTYGEHKVNAVMYNYSSDEEKGLGFLRVITFNGEERSITVASYNAVTEATEYDEAHPEYDNFVIENAF